MNETFNMWKRYKIRFKDSFDNVILLERQIFLICEADHSPPSSSEIKNCWSYTSTPPY
jgi:hypothetical protein